MRFTRACWSEEDLTWTFVWTTAWQANECSFECRGLSMTKAIFMLEDTTATNVLFAPERTCILLFWLYRHTFWRISTRILDGTMYTVFCIWIIAYVLLCLVLSTRLYKLGHIDRRPRSSLILSLMPLLQNVWARISIFQTWYFSGWCQITVHTVYYWQRPRVFLEQIPALRLWVNNLLMLMSQELQELGQSACG